MITGSCDLAANAIRGRVETDESSQGKGHDQVAQCSQEPIPTNGSTVHLKDVCLAILGRFVWRRIAFGIKRLL